MYEFKLPDLGEGIHEGELLKWYVKEGETIIEDDPLCDVETDKAAVTIPSPRGGKVVSLKGKVGDILHTGEVFAVIDDGSGAAAETPAAPEPEKKETAAATAPAKAEAPKAAVAAAPPSDGRPVPAAPATRRMAREMGIDINRVPGTGPGGRVTPEDLKAFSEGRVPAAASAAPASAPAQQAAAATEAARPAPVRDFEASGIPFLEVEVLPEFEKEGPVQREALRSLRRKVAHRMTTSMILVPHVAHMDEADVTEMEAFRLRMRETQADQPGATKLTLMPFVMKAVSALLRKWPMFNASLDPHREELVYKKYYNIGFAADTPRGLLVPVVKGTDKKSILDISADVMKLATKGREGTIEVGEMQHGTFTITNVGPIGGTGLIPTINYPEVAILGMARVQEKPVVRNGEIVIRKILPLTLTFDHRVADGAQAARFMTELIRLLSDPGILLIES